MENISETKLLERRTKKLRRLSTRILFLLIGDRIEDKNLRELWKQSGLSIEQVAVGLSLSYERVSHILYGEKAGRKVRVKFVRYFQNECNRLGRKGLEPYST